MERRKNAALSALSSRLEVRSKGILLWPGPEFQQGGGFKPKTERSATPQILALLSSWKFLSSYLDNVTLANPQVRESRLAWAEAPRSLWEARACAETVRRHLPWKRGTRCPWRPAAAGGH